MATIYRFIIESKTSGGGGSGRNTSGGGNKKKQTAKKGRWVSVIGGDKGGVEHNRKLRAINPLLNKMTGGYWEKGMRLGRAGLGLVQRNTETGKIGLSGTAVAIIIAFVIQAILKWQNHERQIANQLNTQNFKALENGFSSIRGQFDISVNMWNGRRTFNQNK